MHCTSSVTRLAKEGGQWGCPTLSLRCIDCLTWLTPPSSVAERVCLVESMAASATTSYEAGIVGSRSLALSN